MSVAINEANKRRKFYVVDFEDGTQIIQGSWLSDDLTVCSWPPWGDELEQLSYDKKMRVTPNPDEDWNDCCVLRIRAKGDSFEYVRKKLRDAELYEDTDLNTETEDVGKPKRRRIRQKLYDSDEENLTGKYGDNLEVVTKRKLPKPPLTTIPTPSTSKEQPSLHKRRLYTSPLPPDEETFRMQTASNNSSFSNFTPSRTPSISSEIFSDTTSEHQNNELTLVPQCQSEDKISVSARKMTDAEFKAFVIRNFLRCNRQLGIIRSELEKIKNCKGGNQTERALSVTHTSVLVGLPLFTRSAMCQWDKKLSESEFAVKVEKGLTLLVKSCKVIILVQQLNTEHYVEFNVGKPAEIGDLNNPGYVPHIKMGYNSNNCGLTSKNRYIRAQKRECNRSRLKSKVRNQDKIQNVECPTATTSTSNPSPTFEIINENFDNKSIQTEIDNSKMNNYLQYELEIRYLN
ncbi:hypothetical protein FQR65_LT15896 [Abscondita terminalis]|nr:hypothetical protein FQR65_LT15896 [Abscondita terminalis]